MIWQAWAALAFTAFIGASWLAYELYNARPAEDDDNQSGADEGAWRG